SPSRGCVYGGNASQENCCENDRGPKKQYLFHHLISCAFPWIELWSLYMAGQGRRVKTENRLVNNENCGWKNRQIFGFSKGNSQYSLINFQFSVRRLRLAAQPPRNLERQADLALEIPLDRGGLAENGRAFACDLAERRGADGEIGSHELRMIQDVRGVQSNRQLLGLRETERLRDVPVEVEDAGAVQRTVPEVSDLSRSWIHQYIDGRSSGPCCGQGVQRTECTQ